MVDIDRADIQGNILEAYTLSCTKHLFLRFVPGRGRAALAAVHGQITNAQRWDGPRPSSTLNLGLSYAGLQALKLPEDWLASLPPAFRAGMSGRAAELSDDLRNFEAAWQAPVHLWLWIHAMKPEELQLRAHALLELLTGNAELVLERDGIRRRNADGQLIEHFGFRDGISQPSVVGSFSAARPGNGISTEDGGWRSLATGEFLIGHQDETGDTARAGSLTDLTQNATFAVFRELEQDVKGFWDYVRAQAAHLSTPGSDVDETWIAERMVGRRRDGTPLGSPQGTGSADSLNAFTFKGDPEGRTCPLGSHIRRANVRDGKAFAVSFARHRIIRRGMTYGELYDAAKEQADPRGLLFVALNADLERQFEFLQRLYMNDGAAARQGRDVDPVVSALSGNFVIPGDLAAQRDTVICSKVPSFVVCRGGEYFMLPGIRGLELLRSAAAEAPTATLPHRLQPSPGNNNHAHLSGVEQGNQSNQEVSS
jgi:Dyp-type peroxidase family